MTNEVRDSQPALAFHGCLHSGHNVPCCDRSGQDRSRQTGTGKKEVVIVKVLPLPCRYSSFRTR
jgi:hypothetical protein